MVLVAKAHVGSNPTYHPIYLEGNAGCSRMTREPREVTVGNQCVASYNQGKALELYGIVECKGIFWRITQVGDGETLLTS